MMNTFESNTIKLEIYFPEDEAIMYLKAWGWKVDKDNVWRKMEVGERTIYEALQIQIFNQLKKLP